MTHLIPVDDIAAGLVRLAPTFYAGWTGDTVRAWCAATGIPVRRGLVAHHDLLAAMDRQTAERARQALTE